jgi:hypothetical protein
MMASTKRPSWIAASTTSKDSKALTAVPAPVPEQDLAQHSPRAKICNYCNLKWHIAKDCYHKVIDEAFGWEKLPKINRRSQYPRPNHGENVRRYHQTHKGEDNLINEIKARTERQARPSPVAGPSRQQDSQVTRQEPQTVAAEPEVANGQNHGPPMGGWTPPPPQGQPYPPQGGYSGPPQGYNSLPHSGYNGPPQGGYGGPPQDNWSGYNGPSQGYWSRPLPQGGYNGPPPQGGYNGPPYGGC